LLCAIEKGRLNLSVIFGCKCCEQGIHPMGKGLSKRWVEGFFKRWVEGFLKGWARD
jgi:hypothetical protein